VLARRDYMVGDWDDTGQVNWLEGAGGTLIRGHGRLVGERRVDVEQPDGSVREVRARQAVVLATGSVAAIPPVEGLHDIRIWDSRGSTSAKEVPRRLLVLGGGVVGVEMAQAWRRLGAEEVTIFEHSERLLAKEEPFAGEMLKVAFEAEGIAVLPKTSVVKAARDGEDGPVTVTLEDGRTFTGDELLVAVGRRPTTADLGLEHVGLEPGKYVEVDDKLRAIGVPGEWLYAVGDCNGRALLTHMGKYQARIATDVIRGREIEAWADHRAIPRVTFTDPEVAAVGLTERAARERDLNIRTVSYELGNVSAAATIGEDITGTAQLVIDDDRSVIVGATFVGPEVGELLHSATVAVVGEIPLDVLWHAVPSFPTMSEVWLRLLETAGV
jgi:pyruvate/2-oxoglutarate dehydrogenase complex dihydrolipoamide dehydrogenase (E3) component